MSATIVRFPPDAALIAAEREFLSVLDEVNALTEADASEAETDPVYERLWEQKTIIEETTATTLAGAAIKLRMLLDPASGLRVVEAEPCHFLMLEQILAVIEREARP